MTEIKSDDLFFKNGQAYLNINKGTKGGKPRIANWQARRSGNKSMKWFNPKRDGIIVNYDQPFYRATYANRLYNQLKCKSQHKTNTSYEKELARYMTNSHAFSLKAG